MGLDAAERQGALSVYSSTVVGNVITATHPVCIYAGGCLTYKYLGLIASGKEASNGAMCVGVYACATLIAGPYYLPSPGSINIEQIGNRASLRKTKAGDSLIATLSGANLTGGEIELTALKAQ